MSFDIWLDCFRKGHPAPFKREVFEAIFLPFCSNRAEYKSHPSFMQVEYPDGGRADIDLSNLDEAVLESASAGGLIPPEEIGDVLDRAQGDPNFIQHIGFTHCGGDAFFQGMYELASRTGSIIHWPDEDSIFVYTDDTVLKELPQEYFGDARRQRVGSGADIIRAIENS
jgi:hypothetical protein